MQEGWFTTYGDGLATIQSPTTGEFDSRAGAPAATSLAILYYMRSTKQIVDKQYGLGIQVGDRGLGSIFGKEEEEKKDLGPLDALLRQMQDADLSQLDGLDAEDIVDKITFGSREELIGQVDLVKKLLDSKDPANRQAAYFALGRTGDFTLIPLILKGLRDVNLDVNVEALSALRYVAKKPNGFGAIPCSRWRAWKVRTMRNGSAPPTDGARGLFSRGPAGTDRFDHMTKAADLTKSN